jgi:ribosomal-protein-alanine N-acetyltransferase
MIQDDVPEVSRLERHCFPNPWPASAYRRELQNPKQNAYVVLREVVTDAAREVGGIRQSNGDYGRTDPLPGVPRRSLLPIALGRRHQDNGHDQSRIVGFVGMWLAFDEAHITTICVDSEHRGQGLGELMLLCMVDEAAARGANWLTLEVRVSNEGAQALYRKYGFSVQGTRRRYYSDNNEDALIMWSKPLNDATFRTEIEERRAVLATRLAGQLAPGDFAPFGGPVSRAATR